jgi:type IV pilus assembly protein PilM
MAGFKRSSARRSMTGLDIEPGGIRAVEVSVMPGGGVVVERAAEAPLPPGVLRDGEVVDAAALTAALKELFATHKLDRRVRLGVANQRVVMRMLHLPPISDAKQLATAVRFQAADDIPMPLDQAVLDHSALGIVETEEGPRMRVLVVAARRDMIEKLLGAVREAGLKPEGIDLSAFAMIRSLAIRQEAPVLHLAVGGTVNLAVARGGQCLFTRVLAGGFETMALDVAERTSVPVDDARAALTRVGVPKPKPAAKPAEIVPDGELDLAMLATAPAPEPEPEADPVDTAAGRAIEDGLRRLAGEVRSTLDFHLRSDEPVEQVVLTGSGAAIPGFADALSQQLGLPVELAGVPVPDGLEPTRYAVAAGLAIEEMAA